MSGEPDAQAEATQRIDTSVPHSARIWNYWLGGKDNYPVDREIGERMVKLMPELPAEARAWRHFQARAVRYLAGEVGIRQFLDVGTGLPTQDNTHEVAQRVAPESRVVYVDNDPLVLVHAQVLLTSSPEGVTEYIEADLEDPDRILRAAKRILDFDRPVAVMLSGILASVQDYEEAVSVVARLMDALPSGSHLVIVDAAAGIDAGLDEGVRQYNESGAVPYHMRTKEQIAAYFADLEPVEPGLTWCNQWRPEPSPFDEQRQICGFGGVARKP
jgi:hypothetical protein